MKKISQVLRLQKTDSGNKDYQQLVKKLDAYLRICDGDEHAFYAQYNKSDSIKHVIVAYTMDVASGCGALKEYAPGIMEIKRMYVPEEMRGKGIASLILKELEDWALALGYQKCILETGMKQTEAIGLYQKNHYRPIKNYGPYEGVSNSLCFEKKLI